MAISNLFMVLLILTSLIVGALLSYMWVMGSFWNMPQNVTTLAVEDVVFPSNDFSYFNVTVVNPSNSASDVNMTSIKVLREGNSETYDVQYADPVFPFPMTIGTRQTFKCFRNWSNFTGENLRVEPVAGNASILSKVYVPPKTKLIISDFNASENIRYFSLKVQNDPTSTLNLSISEILADGLVVSNSTPPLPFNLSVGQTQTFQIDWNWGILTGRNSTITIRTAEEFEQIYTTPKILGAYAYVDAVEFYYTDSAYLNVTVRNSPESTTETTINGLKITLSNQTTIMPSTLPPLNVSAFPIKLPPNQSITIRCLWDWSAFRNETITVQVLTREGFTVQNKTRDTPPPIVWDLGDIKFDVSDLENFSVNVTNRLMSVQEINITGIEFNQNGTVMTPTIVAPGTQNTIQCTYNWTGFVGSSINITVQATYGTEQTSISRTIILPYFGVVNASYSNFSTGNPYLNITVYNSQYSKTNATIVQISVNVDNSTFVLDGTIAVPRISTQGYTITPASEATFTCPWDWNLYVGKDLTIVVKASNGFQISTTLKVE
jgi:hypothetical protein